MHLFEKNKQNIKKVIINKTMVYESNILLSFLVFRRVFSPLHYFCGIADDGIFMLLPNFFYFKTLNRKAESLQISFSKLKFECSFFTIRDNCL
jgi:hypothetical protein